MATPTPYSTSTSDYLDKREKAIAQTDSLIANMTNLLTRYSGETFIKTIYLYDSDLRKKIHLFAEKNGLYHVSYYDGTMDTEIKYSYYCSECDKRLRHGEYIDYSDCCDNIIICNTCDNNVFDDDCRQKAHYKNNTIVVSNDIEKMKPIFEIKKVSNPIEWIKKRELELKDA